MKRLQQTLNTDWKFARGDPPGAFAKGFDDADWQGVTLPHDWSVAEPFSREHSSGGGYLAGGTGWYRRRLRLPAEAAGKRVLLVFDGVYNHSQVWVNSYYLGRQPYGYSTFMYDISHAASCGGEATEIAVRVDHRHTADSRWFTGSGITRKVSLVIKEPACLAHQGIFFTTPEVKAEQATVKISTTVENHSGRPVQVRVRQTLRDASGRTVLELESACPLPAGEESAAGGQNVEQSGAVERPALWSPANPALYSLETQLLDGDTVLDSEITTVGLRDCRFDPNQGFFLNGHNLKLKGVCLHHDAGCLGAALTKPVWRRRLAVIKESGCNAIRMSHNPHQPELYELCDEMGFLVIDEAFDEWEGPKNKWWQGHNVYPPQLHGYWEDFPEWHEKDLAALVRRDRNHPSVMLWSIGNEIDYPNDPYCHPHFSEMTGNNDANKPAAERVYDPNKPNAQRIAVLSRHLAAIVKRWDPSRPVTAAVAFPELSNITGYCDTLDVCGYNYKEQHYAADHAAWPGRILLGSENSHNLAAWQAVTENDFIAGQFLWTGIDYLGEARGWPVHGSPAGLLDLAGFPKPQFHFRRSLWSSQPMLQLATRRGDGPVILDWNGLSGEELEIRCYTNCPELTFCLDGRPIAFHRLADFSLDGYIHFTFPFSPGCLEAIATIADGELRSRLVTAGPPAAILARTDCTSLRANGEDIAHVELAVTDAAGNPVPTAELMVNIKVEGAATLLGIENGNLADCDDYAAPQRRTYHGRLLAYIRSGRAPGPVKVSLDAGGLVAGAEIRLSVE